MKRFEIVNGMRHNMEPCAVLVWDDDSNFLPIDIDESATEKDVPMLFIPFLRKGQHHIDDAWARRWVEERVVPSDGQNLGQVLRANGLQLYDSMLLLIAGEGRCAQDDFFIQEARDAVASESVSSRVGNIALSPRAGGNKSGGACRRVRHASTNAQSNRTRRNEPHRRNA